LLQRVFMQFIRSVFLVLVCLSSAYSKPACTEVIKPALPTSSQPFVVSPDGLFVFGRIGPSAKQLSQDPFHMPFIRKAEDKSKAEQKTSGSVFLATRRHHSQLLVNRADIKNIIEKDFSNLCNCAAYTHQALLQALRLLFPCKIDRDYALRLFFIKALREASQDALVRQVCLTIPEQYINLCDESGNTLIMLAAKQELSELVATYLAYSTIDLNKRNGAGQTIRDVAQGAAKELLEVHCLVLEKQAEQARESLEAELAQQKRRKKSAKSKSPQSPSALRSIAEHTAQASGVAVATEQNQVQPVQQVQHAEPKRTTKVLSLSDWTKATTARRAAQEAARTQAAAAKKAREDAECKQDAERKHKAVIAAQQQNAASSVLPEKMVAAQQRLSSLVVPSVTPAPQQPVQPVRSQSAPTFYNQPAPMPVMPHIIEWSEPEQHVVALLKKRLSVYDNRGILRANPDAGIWATYVLHGHMQQLAGEVDKRYRAHLLAWGSAGKAQDVQMLYEDEAYNQALHEVVNEYLDECARRELCRAAFDNDRATIIKWLKIVRKNPDHYRDNSGKTPAQIAYMRKHQELVRFLTTPAWTLAVYAR
jgi:hypothetical protein